MPRRKNAPPIKPYIEPPDIGELKKKADQEPAPEPEAPMDARITPRALDPLTASVRPRGIVAMVKTLTDNGWDILKFLDDVFRGQAEGFSGRERLEAAKILMDRGFGKAVETTVLIDATRAEQDAELRSVPTEQLYQILKTLAPPAQAAVGRLEVNEPVPMPDVVQGAALGQVVDAEYEEAPHESPQSELDAANRAIYQARLNRAELVKAGLLEEKHNKSRVIVKQKGAGAHGKVLVNQPPPTPEEPNEG